MCVYCVCTVCVLCVYCVCTVSVLRVYFVCTVCVMCVHFVCTVCVLTRAPPPVTVSVMLRVTPITISRQITRIM